MLYNNTEVKVTVAGVLQGDTLVLHLLIICLDYVLRTSIEFMKDNSFKLAKKESEDTRYKVLRTWTTLMT